MVSGRKIIEVETTNKDTQDKVLVGEVEVGQPVSAYIFTGQGSPEQGMGMSLSSSSPVAREVLYRDDRHSMKNYGESFPLLFSFTTLTILHVSQSQTL